MKNNYIILLGVVSLTAIGAFLLITQKEKKQVIRKQRQEVSDEGYEFAYDVLYPLKNKRIARETQWEDDLLS
jgi:hypothetical protein